MCLSSAVGGMYNPWIWDLEFESVCLFDQWWGWRTHHSTVQKLHRAPLITVQEKYLSPSRAYEATLILKSSVVKNINWERLCPSVCMSRQTGTSWQDAVYTKLTCCAKICLTQKWISPPVHVHFSFTSDNKILSRSVFSLLASKQWRNIF